MEQDQTKRRVLLEEAYSLSKSADRIARNRDRDIADYKEALQAELDVLE